jgi:prepilin-type N-terminal cleavage/methylation domain-containing protein
MNKTKPNERENRGRSEGMTIIELMIVLVIASVFAIAMYKVFESSAKMASRQNVDIDAQEGVRSALNFMAKDICMAGLATSSMGGAPGILIADESTLRVQFDRDLSGAIETGNNFGDANYPEMLEYALENPGAAETRLIVTPNPPNGAPIVLLENVTDLTFSYIDANNARLEMTGSVLPLVDSANRAELKRIRAVEISLTARAAHTATTTGREFTSLKYIRCRNLGIWP